MYEINANKKDQSHKINDTIYEYGIVYITIIAQTSNRTWPGEYASTKEL